MNPIFRWVEELNTRTVQSGKRLMVAIEGEAHRFKRAQDLGGSSVRLFYTAQRGGGTYATVIERMPQRHGGGFVVRDEDDEFVELYLEDDIRRHAASSKSSSSIYVGQRFGLLVVREMMGRVDNTRMALCDCECGGTKEARVSSLLSGDLISCGCRRGKNRELALTPGEVFGRLRVLEQVERPPNETRNEGYYLVRCTCGNEVIRRRELLVRGLNPDCGCRGRNELVGQRFGQVIILDETRRSQRHRMYKVLCDCGRTAWLRINDLRTGKARSCGCLRGQPAGQ